MEGQSKVEGKSQGLAVERGPQIFMRYFQSFIPEANRSRTLADFFKVLECQFLTENSFVTKHSMLWGVALVLFFTPLFCLPQSFYDRQWLRRKQSAVLCSLKWIVPCCQGLNFKLLWPFNVDHSKELLSQKGHVQLLTQSDNCTSENNCPFPSLPPSQRSLLTISSFPFIVSKIF